MSIIPGSIESKLKLKEVIENSTDPFELIEALLKAFYTSSSSLNFLYKMGEHGSILFYPEMSSDGTIIIKKIEKKAYSFENFKNLKLVDTTGAGDSYTATFSYGLLQSSILDKNARVSSAIDLATKAAFLTISRQGAAPAMPFIDEINTIF